MLLLVTDTQIMLLSSSCPTLKKQHLNLCLVMAHQVGRLIDLFPLWKLTAWLPKTKLLLKSYMMIFMWLLFSLTLILSLLILGWIEKLSFDLYLIRCLLNIPLKLWQSTLTLMLACSLAHCVGLTCKLLITLLWSLLTSSPPTRTMLKQLEANLLSNECVNLRQSLRSMLNLSLKRVTYALTTPPLSS